MLKTIWEADQASLHASNIWRFKCDLESKYGIDLNSYRDLHQYSVDSSKAFWNDLSDFVSLKWQKRSEKLFQPGSRFIDSHWGGESEINYAENLIHKAPEEAVVSWDETRGTVIHSREDLKRHVALIQKFLLKQGVKKGDRIAAVMPNGYEAIAAMLAATALGAIWSSGSPDFGESAIVDRFGQIDPTIYIAVMNYSYNGRVFDVSSVHKKVIAQLNPKAVLTYRACRESGKAEEQALHSAYPEISMGFLDRIMQGQDGDGIVPEVFFEKTRFDDPLYIMYSSGTTGVPKCIVHGIGGTLLQHAKEHQLHCDLKPGDKMLYFTTCGWMMWNWMVSALASSVTIVTWDGSPSFPNWQKFWEVIADQGVNCLGTSPKYLQYLINSDAEPKASGNLNRLQTILSTGAPLLEEHYEYVYEKIKQDIHLASICGGTDIISCFMLGNKMSPVYRGYIQGAGLGMDVDCLDENGQSLRNAKGELVCRQPFVSQPIYFWNDPDKQKFKKSYFSTFANLDIWQHGDFIEIDEASGQIKVYGRSDATLNPGGVRIGTAEIYRVVESLDSVVDSLVVGVPYHGDVAIVLFVKMRDQHAFDESFKQGLGREIKEKLSPRHKPGFMYAVTDIPYTRSGKKMELLVKLLLEGKDPKNTGAVANPECLKQYKSIQLPLHND